MVCSDGRGKTRPYRDGDFDILVGYDLFSDRAYVYLWSELKGVTTRKSMAVDALERWDKLTRC